MDPEKVPLLISSQLPSSSYTNAENTSSSEDSELNLSVFNDGEQEQDDSFEIDDVPYSNKITFTWSEINAFALERSSNRLALFKYFQSGKDHEPQGKQILSNVNGIAKPGELLAILGSSGAGKTTLLNILTSRSSSNLIISGLRCANGIPLHSNSLTSQLAYVQQDDLFIGNLTVREHLVFQALVRMDKLVPYNQRISRVDEVISELGLNDCRHTMIGVKGKIKGISGGEMKRLSFAAEVLTNPSLMFCDEPTSGLDSFMALNVIQVLKRLARKGKTVVCTIHQPSSDVYSMFDKVLLMAEGRVAFLGTPNEATIFFAGLQAPCPHNFNPSDYFIQLLAILPGREESCRQAVNMVCDRFERSDLGVRVAVKAATLARSEYTHMDVLFNEMSYRNRYKASWCSQFRAVLWRSWITILKEPLLIKVRMLQTIIVALLIGVIYFGQTLNKDGVMNINGAIFIFLTNMTFQNVFAVINVFCAELPILLRENKNGMYRTDVYFICKTLAELPLFIILPVTFLSICYYLIGLNSQQPRVFVAIGVLILVANSAISFGYFVSCLSNSISMALSLAPPMIIPFLLFGGYFMNISAIPWYFKWLGYASWFRYGNEALMINQWSGVDSINCTRPESLICPKNGHVILETYSFSENNFSMDLIALAVLICGFRLLAYLALLFKTYQFE